MLESVTNVGVFNQHFDDLFHRFGIRDRLLSLRNNSVLLNDHICQQVSQLGLRRRGCRAGAHRFNRLQVAHSVTSSVSRPRTGGEIPVIIGRRTVFTNNQQLFRRDRKSQLHYARLSASQSAVVRLDEHTEMSMTMPPSPATEMTTEPFLCPRFSTFRSVPPALSLSCNIDSDCAVRSQTFRFRLLYKRTHALVRSQPTDQSLPCQQVSDENQDVQF